MFTRPTRALSAADAVRLSAQGAVAILDVRGADEIARTGKARGAHHIPLPHIPSRCDPRRPDFDATLSGRPIAVYCASGNRSGTAVQLLRSMGHAEVHNIGGLGDWIAAGGVVD